MNQKIFENWHFIWLWLDICYKALLLAGEKAARLKFMWFQYIYQNLSNVWASGSSSTQLRILRLSSCNTMAVMQKSIKWDEQNSQHCLPQKTKCDVYIWKHGQDVHTSKKWNWPNEAEAWENLTQFPSPRTRGTAFQERRCWDTCLLFLEEPSSVRSNPEASHFWLVNYCMGFAQHRPCRGKKWGEKGREQEFYRFQKTLPQGRKRDRQPRAASRPINRFGVMLKNWL